MEALMNSEKILFIQTAFPGDAILTLPALKKLKDFFPDSTIEVLCIPTTKEIFEASPSVDRVITIDKKGEQKSLRKTYKFIRELKQNNYSKIYSSHRSLRTSLIVLMLEVRETFGFDNSDLMHVYKYLINYDINKHEVQRNLDLIGFGYDEQSWKIIPPIEVDATATEKVNLFFKDHQLENGFIAIAPGSVWNTKKYPSEYFEVIIKHFIDQKNKIVLIGGENDKVLNDSIASKFTDGVINSAGNFSIVESIKLLTKAKLLISNDSAPTHMGVCADIKVLTIYCSTVPEFGFYPYNKNSKAISFEDLKCKPCGIHGHDSCPIKTFDCGLKLLPQEIILKAEEMVNE
jgi:heptosyltransferase II